MHSGPVVKAGNKTNHATEIKWPTKENNKTKSEHIDYHKYKIKKNNAIHSSVNALQFSCTLFSIRMTTLMTDSQ